MRTSERALNMIVIDPNELLDKESTKKRFTEFIVKLLVTQMLVETGETSIADAVWGMNP